MLAINTSAAVAERLRDMALYGRVKVVGAGVYGEVGKLSLHQPIKVRKQKLDYVVCDLTCLTVKHPPGCYTEWNRTVITSFQGRSARDIWEHDSSGLLPRALWLRAKALLTIMHSSKTLNDLRIKGQPPNIRLHKLVGDRKGRWSVTIKLPWCITFKFHDGDFSEVTIENYHGG